MILPCLPLFDYLNFRLIKTIASRIQWPLPVMPISNNLNFMQKPSFMVMIFFTKSNIFCLAFTHFKAWQRILFNG